jgi:hypothetical protein
LVTEVSGHPVGPIFRDQAVQNCLTLEDGTNRLTRNFGKFTNLLFVTSKESEHLRSKKLENANCFDYLGSVVINDERCTQEIKSGITMAGASFSRKETNFNGKLEFNLR